ncbi:Conserved_hypothetical protein [Hexamita inflata]|uniref:Uncharacterized protein n=1 Tax=Hexamita inflata TaxID=28002 RepID=A0AA86N9Q3_9EUKA|nr:Conserved hypothetical protein [Hexamita inflata]
MTELPALNNKVFVPHQKWQYIVKQYEYNQNTPCCVDVIDTDLPLYNEYYDLMKKRVTKYSKLQYVLLTKNSANQILWFVKKFPFFQKIVNVVYLTKEMESIICAQQLPFCFILNQKQHIVYRGPISTENYFSTISYLNELKSNQLQDFNLSFFKADSLNLQNTHFTEFYTENRFHQTILSLHIIFYFIVSNAPELTYSAFIKYFQILLIAYICCQLL